MTQAVNAFIIPTYGDNADIYGQMIAPAADRMEAISTRLSAFRRLLSLFSERDLPPIALDLLRSTDLEMDVLQALADGLASSTSDEGRFRTTGRGA